MSLTRRFEDRPGLRTTSRLLDGAFLLLLVGAVGVCHATGLGPAGLAAVLVGSFGLEYAVSNTLARSVVDGTGPVGDAPERVRRTVGDLCVAMGIDAPRVVVDRTDDAGINVLGDGDRTVVVVAESLLSELDDASVRGVLAHELAHVSLGHIRRVPARESVTHVVGFATLWVVALQHVSIPLALLGGIVYLSLAVGPTHTLGSLVVVVASLGVVLVPVALSAWAARLEECRADDVAVAHSSPLAFCRGLHRVGTAAQHGDAVAGDAPLARRRSPLERLTARYPTVEFRLARQGVTLEDVADE